MASLFKKAFVPTPLTQIGCSGNWIKEGRTDQSHNCKLRNMTTLTRDNFAREPFRNVIRPEELETAIHPRMQVQVQIKSRAGREGVVVVSRVLP